jgi:hypothetical protein
MNHSILDKSKTRWAYRRRLFVIASILLFAIAMLAIIQWTIGTRGWDLAAGLLTIVMVAGGFALAGVLILMLLGRPKAVEEWAGQEMNREPIAKHSWEEPSWYDPYDPASPYYERRD